MAIVETATRHPALLGLSFRTAGITLRSRLVLTGPNHSRALDALKDAGASEALVLSTCNRTEILAYGLDQRAMRELLGDLAGVSEVEIAPHLYGAEGSETARQLFRVCSGMDSAALGETEILVQVKEAWEASRQQGLIGKHLDFLLREALRVSKRVRTETDLCRGVVSYAGLAVREVSARIGGYSGKQVLVMGAGQMGERIVRELRRTPPQRVIIVSRSDPRASELAVRYGHSHGSWERFLVHMRQSDAVFAALSGAVSWTSVDGPVVADLGVPPVFPHGLPGTNSFGIDLLIDRCQRNAETRAEALPRAHAIIDEELLRFEAELRRREAIR